MPIIAALTIIHSNVLKRRRHIETVNGNVKNRGLGRLNVRGLIKAQCVALLHALAHNLWRGHGLRTACA